MSDFHKNLAIIIGINNYENGIHPLTNAQRDALELADILETKHGYEEVIRIIDKAATKKKLLELLQTTLPQYNLTKSDRLLFYFAGHGVALDGDDGPAGYIVPQDADLESNEKLIAMTTLYKHIASLKCRHLLFILDCCFAGTFRWSSTRRFIHSPKKITKAHYDRFINSPAWQVITSAAYNQEAFDFIRDNRGIGKDKQHSPFAEALFAALGGEADIMPPARDNKPAGDGVITATELYLYLRDSVEKQSKDMQTPGIWTLPKHERGEYIFLTPERELDLAETPELNPDNNPYRGLEPFEERHSQFFFGRQELVTELAQRLNQEHNRLTVVLGASGSGKSSLVKAGLIPLLKQISEPEVFTNRLIWAYLCTLAILRGIPLCRPQFLPINYINQWKIIASMRPGEYPFTVLARSVWAISGYLPITEKTSLNFISESLTNYLSQNDEQQIKALQQNWSDAPLAQKLLLISDRFYDFKKVCQNTQNQAQLTDLRNSIQQSLQQLIDDLSSNPQKLVDIINNWTQTHPQTQLLLVIDQFEELITLTHQTDTTTNLESMKTWQSFLNLLATTLNTCPQFHLVVTLRSDFETRFLDSALKAYWSKARFPVRPMVSSELREAIERPASERALYFKPANLVDRLIDEVGQMPGALPLLSFTLSELYLKFTKTWDDTQDRALTIDEEFERQGGVGGALKNRANQEYDNLGDEKLQATMRRVMLRMLTVEGGELTRRQVPDSELVYPDKDENERVKLVIERLVDTRLVVRGQGIEEEYTEPAHDILVKNWEKITQWLTERQANKQKIRQFDPISAIKSLFSRLNGKPKTENRVNQMESEAPLKFNLQLQRELTIAGNHWGNEKKAAGFLWNDDPRLSELLQILNSEDNWLNQRERDFVEQSRTRKRRIQTLTWGSIGVVTLGSIIFSFAVWTQWINSELNRADSLGRLSLSLFDEGKELDAMIESIRAGKILQKHQATNPEVMRALITNIYQGSERNRFEGHNDYVNSVSMSNDGKTLVSGSDDQTIKVWNLETGEIIHTLTTDNYNDPIYSVIVNPNNQNLVGGSYSGTIKVWNLETGEVIHTFTRSNGPIWSVSVSKDGQTMVSGSGDGTIKVWNLETGKLIRTLAGHTQSVFSVSVSPDGQTLVSGSMDKTIKVWNLKTGKLIRTLTGHTQSVFSVSVSPDGQTLVSGSIDQTIKVWNLKTGKLIHTLTGHTQSVFSVSVSPDGQTLVSGSMDKTIKVWNLKTGKAIRTLTGHSRSVHSVSISPDGQTLISGSEDKTIKVWNLEMGGESRTLTGHTQSVFSVSVSLDGQTLVSGSDDGTIKVWNLENGKPIHTLPGDGTVYSVSACPDRKTFVSSDLGSMIKVWNLETGKLIHNLSEHNHAVVSVSVSPDCQTFILGSDEGIIGVWNLETGEKISTLSGYISPDYLNISVSLDGQTFISGFSPDGHERAFATIKVWNPEIGKPIHNLSGHDDTVYSVSMSPDGQTLVSGSDDQTIKLWNLETGEEILTLTEHNDAVVSVSVSSDGQTLVSGSDDQTIKLWNLETGELISTFSGHDDTVYSVSMSPDGQTLVSGSGDGTIKVWNLDFDFLMGRSCDRVRAYLHNPSVNLSESDRRLCDEFSEKIQKTKAN